MEEAIKQFVDMIEREKNNHKGHISSNTKLADKLDAYTFLQAARANYISERDLGLTNMLGTGTLNNATALNVRQLEDAIKNLQSHELIEQKHFINLMASIGITVMTNDFTEKPILVLPKNYEEAILELKKHTFKANT
jgi:hypothetical protein